MEHLAFGALQSQSLADQLEEVFDPIKKEILDYRETNELIAKRLQRVEVLRADSRALTKEEREAGAPEITEQDIAEEEALTNREINQMHSPLTRDYARKMILR